jgi:hypothetical protein
LTSVSSLVVHWIPISLMLANPATAAQQHFKPVDRVSLHRPAIRYTFRSVLRLSCGR